MKRRGNSKYIQMVRRAGIAACVVLAMLLLVVLLPLFQKKQPVKDGQSVSTAETDAPEYMEATAVWIATEKNNQIIMYHSEAGEEYVFSTDGATAFYDKYGQAMSREQLECGDIVDIKYLPKKSYLAQVKQSNRAWKYTDVERYELKQGARELVIGKEHYRISEDAKCFLGGELIEISDVSSGDLLTIQGVGQDVYSIRVQRGHGYLKLENEEAFEGGWLEIGRDNIHGIKKDMRIAVPEGTHEVTISYKGYMDTRTIEIQRDCETIMDVGDLADRMIKYGKVYITTTPENAKVYIDGTRVDTSRLISMEYGLHQLIAKADGYETITQYFRLEKESASLEIILRQPEEPEVSDKDKEESTESSKESESTESSSKEESSSSASEGMDASEKSEDASKESNAGSSTESSSGESTGASEESSSESGSEATDEGGFAEGSAGTDESDQGGGNAGADESSSAESSAGTGETNSTEGSADTDGSTGADEGSATESSSKESSGAEENSSLSGDGAEESTVESSGAESDGTGSGQQEPEATEPGNVPVA